MRKIVRFRKGWGLCVFSFLVEVFCWVFFGCLLLVLGVLFFNEVTSVWFWSR